MASSRRLTAHAAGPADDSGGSAAPAEPQPALRRQAAAALAAAALLLGGAAPQPAAALLSSPSAAIPRTADVALRRSIPAFNARVRGIQSDLEGIAFKLRIPQRKPWAGMGADLAAATELAGDKGAMLAGVLAPDLERAMQELEAIRAGLDRLGVAVENKDADRTSQRLAAVLGGVARLELLQAPGLAFTPPRQYDSLPRLLGRGEVDLTVQKASGARVFFDPTGEQGPQARTRLRITLDGYSAPLTAGAFAASVADGAYDGTTLLSGGDALLARAAGGLQAAKALPLEILAAGDFEPHYRVPLDVQGGELPVLPLSIYGAVAMAHAPGDDTGGLASGSQWFIYKYDRQAAGLAGLSFDEGQFGVVGYVTQGAEALSKLETGDMIVMAELLPGAKLVRPAAAGQGPQD